MLRWTFAFLLFALVSGVLGFTGLASDFAGIARILFFAFLILLCLSFVLGRRKVVV